MDAVFVEHAFYARPRMTRWLVTH